MSGRSLLELDPELAQLVPEERLAESHAHLRARVARLSAGEWETDRFSGAGRNEHLGLLVLDGVIAHEVLLAGSASTELLGAGDVLRPWSLGSRDQPLLRRSVRWHLLSETVVAVLDRDFARRLGGWPEVNAVLMDRLRERSERLATTQAISQLTRVDRRLLAFFWHVAERWGRVTADGVLVPLALSHRMLGQLVGARRPTVTTAVCKLAEDGALVRRPDGAWLLAGSPDSARLDGDAAVLVLPRRRVLVERPSFPAERSVAAAR